MDFSAPWGRNLPFRTLTFLSRSASLGSSTQVQVHLWILTVGIWSSLTGSYNASCPLNQWVSFAGHFSNLTSCTGNFDAHGWVDQGGQVEAEKGDRMLVVLLPLYICLPLLSPCYSILLPPSPRTPRSDLLVPDFFWVSSLMAVHVTFHDKHNTSSTTKMCVPAGLANHVPNAQTADVWNYNQAATIINRLFPLSMLDPMLEEAYTQYTYLFLQSVL